MPDWSILFERERQRILDEVDRRIGLFRTTVAAQDDGVVVANDHRILNFQGPGVTVTDDPVRRRANVFVPGSPVAAPSDTVLLSTAGTEKVYDNGTSDTGPSGWQLAAFNHSGWTTSLLDAAGPSWNTPPTGAVYVVLTTSAQPGTEVWLYYRAITVPAGSITAASIQVIADNYVTGVWVNGNALTVDPALDGVIQTLSIPVGYLTPGATNDLAIQIKNKPAVGTNVMRLAYRLTVTLAGAGTDTQYIPWSVIDAAGDLIVGTGADAGTRLAKGSNGTFLGVSGGSVGYYTPSTGMTNPMTTQDDLIVGGASGAAARLAKGTDGQVLTVDPTTHHLVWATPASALADPMTTIGDLIYRNGSNVTDRLPAGTGGYALVSNGPGAAPSYQAVGAGAGGALSLISVQTLGANAASVTFSSIPGTYTHLLLVYQGRSSTAASGLDTLLMRLNGDTGSNYDYHTGTSSTSSWTAGDSFGQTSARVGLLVQNSAAAGLNAAGFLIIPAYALTTFHKNYWSATTSKLGTSAGNIRNEQNAGSWRSTAAITSITLLPGANNILSGSTFSLYGLG